MPPIRMGDALGLRPSPLSSYIRWLFGATLPRNDPSRYGMADYDLYGGKVNFDIAKLHGLQRPVIRVGQGYYGIDPQFVASSANSKGLFSRDFYWMIDTKQSANGQANACADALLANGKLDSDSILFADFELAPANASVLYGFLTTLHSRIPTLRLGIYTGLSYWATYGSTDPSWAQYPLWIAWPISPYQEPPVPKPWNDYLYHQWTFAGDGYYYGLANVGDGLDLDYMNPRLAPLTDMTILQHSLSLYSLQLTPSLTDTLPLRNSLQQATAFGWEAAMHFGAGYVDTTLPDGTPAGKVKGVSRANGVTYSDDTSFGYYIADANTWIPFARRLIDQGVVNPNLDTTYMAPWCILGFDATHTNGYFIMTHGLENVSGMTQMQAAQRLLALGIEEAYLGDSGHPADIEAGGETIYSPYGEGGPQCIGFLPKGVSGMSTKVTVNAGQIANIKDMATGTLLHQAVAGEFMYGTKNSLGTDVTGFTHYYTAQGVLVELVVSDPSKGAKVSLGTNVTVQDGVVEPTPNPTPTPTPTPTVVSVVMDIATTVTYSDGTVKKFAKTGVSLDPL